MFSYSPLYIRKFRHNLTKILKEKIYIQKEGTKKSMLKPQRQDKTGKIRKFKV